MSNGGDLPPGAHARAATGGSARGRVGTVRRGPRAVKGQLRASSTVGLVGFAGRRVAAASASAAPVAPVALAARAPRRGAVLASATSGTSPSIAALLWLPLAVLELTGVAHGVEIDTDHLRLGDVVAQRLHRARVRAARGRDPRRRPRRRSSPATCTAHELPSRAGVPRHRAVGIARPRHPRLRDRRGCRAPLLRVPGFVIAALGRRHRSGHRRRGTRALRAPRRSRDLVRGSFRPVALFVVLAFVVSETITNVAGRAARPAAADVGRTDAASTWCTSSRRRCSAWRRPSSTTPWSSTNGPDANEPAGGGPVAIRMKLVRPQASRTFLATAIPIAARMRMMSSFFMVPLGRRNGRGDCEHRRSPPHAGAIGPPARSRSRVGGDHLDRDAVDRGVVRRAGRRGAPGRAGCCSRRRAPGRPPAGCRAWSWPQPWGSDTTPRHHLVAHLDRHLDAAGLRA